MGMLEDLRSEKRARVKPGELKKASGDSLTTIYRAVKGKRLEAIEDPVTKRIYITAASALAYLEGRPYQLNHLDTSSIERMEKARAAKTTSKKAVHS